MGGVSVQQIVVRERERIKQQCIDAVRHVSVWGTGGVGRKSAEQVHNEVLKSLRELNVAAVGEASVEAQMDENQHP